MLHWKPDSRELTVADLDIIFKDVCPSGGLSPDPTKKIFDLIDEQASACLKADAGVNFENKIVLAIAARVRAERYILNKINDDQSATSISSNQTQVLISKFARKFPAEVKAIKILNRVEL